MQTPTASASGSQETSREPMLAAAARLLETKGAPAAGLLGGKRGLSSVAASPARDARPAGPARELTDLPSYARLLAPGAQHHLLSELSAAEEKATRRVTNATYGDAALYTGPYGNAPVYRPEFDQSAFRYVFSAKALRIPAAASASVMKFCRTHKLLMDVARIRAVVSDTIASTAPFKSEAGALGSAAPAAASDVVPSTGAGYSPKSLADLVHEYDLWDAAVTARLEQQVVSPLHRRILLNFFCEIPRRSHIFPVDGKEAGSVALSGGGGEAASSAMADESVAAAAPSSFPVAAFPMWMPEGLSEVLASVGGTLVDHVVVLSYDYHTADAVLRALMPPHAAVPSGFATVGHIAHLNLRAANLPYRRVIGAVLIDKAQRNSGAAIPSSSSSSDASSSSSSPAAAAAGSLRTVMNKLGTINNVYRNFGAEVIAGDADFVARLKEQSAVFEFDFSAVYWNSRLQTEHTRVVDFILAAAAGQRKAAAAGVARAGAAGAAGAAATSPVAYVMDPFAGVGPFAIPAALRGCRVFASDLNPLSAYYMRRNARLNKVDSAPIPALPKPSPSSSASAAAAAAAAAGQGQQKGQQGQAQPQAKGWVSVWNADAREFIRSLAREQVAQAVAAEAKAAAGVRVGMGGAVEVPWFDHVLMNLPASAAQFVDAFRGMYSQPLTAAAAASASAAAAAAGVPAAAAGAGPETLLPPPLRAPMPYSSVPPAVDASGNLIAAAAGQSTSSSASASSSLMTDNSDQSSDLAPAACTPTVTLELLQRHGLRQLPIVHCYCFSRDLEDPCADSVKQVERYLGYRFARYVPTPRGKFVDAAAREVGDAAAAAGVADDIASEDSEAKGSAASSVPAEGKPRGKRVDVARTSKGSHSQDYSAEDVLAAIEAQGVAAVPVRDVAPSKEMVCVSFRLPVEVAFEDWTAVQVALHVAALRAEAEAAEDCEGDAEDDADAQDGRSGEAADQRTKKQRS